ncbi:MAG: insulinase family protein [Planctomycetes bacterium]|nr:insulinase family protein [Planctomycetota bacterium]
MKERLDQYRLNNGMVILGEPMDEVESVSFHFLLPAGNASFPDGCCGAGKVIADWILRGAGIRNNRQLTETLDNLGIHRGSAVTEEHFSLSASLEAGNMIAAMDLFADILIRPRFDDDQFEPSRQLALHELAGLEDDPQHKVMLLTKEQFYPYPYNRPAEGTVEDLQALTPQGCREMIQSRLDWSQCIFTVAGKYDFQAVCDTLEKRFAALSGTGIQRPGFGDRGQRYTHHANEGAQVHIGMMTTAPSIGDDRYYDILAAVSVLSGGMSGRLFTEVREKRGLCYAVGARYQSLKNTAGVSCYTGTMPDKAQEAYDVIRQEFRRLRQGITEEELQRAKIGLKSKLIMQSESTQARSSGIAGDFAYLGRVRALDEIRRRLEKITIQSVQDFLDANPFENFTVVTIGPKKIQP